MPTDCCEQHTLFALDQQQVTVRFDGGRVVCDAGLLALGAFEQRLGIIAGLAERFPDPRAAQFIVHSSEELLTQRVYQILAGYPDGNDAQSLRTDPLFQTVAHVSPDAGRPLASGSTLNRFHYAYTRRQAELPREERPVLLEQQAALNGRLWMVNHYLVELFVRTRRQRPASVIIDLDATDDPTHGQQVLSFFHGYYEQYQYLPLLAFDGETGFPLAAWLRPGTVPASCGAVSVLRDIGAQLRQAWPDVLILVRGAIEQVRTQIWDLYQDLKAYRAQPNEAQRPGLQTRFEALVGQRTGYPSIDGVLKEMRDHQDDLLRVLTRPEIPLHNNAMEWDIREFVKRRKISGGTRNAAGRRCRDTFASLKKTCRKLGISFWRYLHDRVRGFGEIPRLPDVIRQKAREAATPIVQTGPAQPCPIAA